ncbi:hypothetical protein VT84_23475 [Gemmata sp. SH-PL17]|nr:hypothetical protein [Gemmata sp. SH-PL17]AMV27380.1 hypothetical protein VT84_23475 [Gemmata sp. SH-PL17]
MTCTTNENKGVILMCPKCECVCVVEFDFENFICDECQDAMNAETAE